jgi:SsrA-binding protein
MTIVPLRLYFNAKGRAKIAIALGRGKKLHDKRDSEKARDWNRHKSRLMRDRGLRREGFAISGDPGPPRMMM